MKHRFSELETENRNLETLGMNIVRHSDPDFAAQLRAAAASSLFDAEIEQRARVILDAVRVRGDAALLEFTERFDGAKCAADRLAVSQAELFNASIAADELLRNAVAAAEKNVVAFAKKSLRKNWQTKNSHGACVGEKFDPFQRVGIYIPGGTAPLVSTALMTIPLAKVAGCKEIVVTTPCGRDGSINPALLFAARAAGATEIYRVGGAQAIAAMACGTETIRRVQKIFGPGNAYVVTAKRLLVGRVAIDLLPGPSELLVLADETANPKFIAADMLAQAEHGSGHERVWLATTSAKVLSAVEKEITKQMSKLVGQASSLSKAGKMPAPRHEFIQRALQNNGWLIQVKSLADGVALANRLAPEHCEVMTRQPRKVSEGILTAGAIFLGRWSPTVLGDYVAGPSHTLPTGGAGASFAGLTVDQFQRRTSVVEYSRAALKKALPTVKKFAELEGLGAHGKSAEVRVK
jgi:histidinol dehydrogenase